MESIKTAVNHADATFTNNDIVVYIMLAIATFMDITKVNQYLYTLFLVIGIILGILSIVEKIKKKK